MFKEFIERFREVDPLLVESVLYGYSICFESEYYRGTNNKSEVDLIKSGEIRPSLNHLSKGYEKGLSVSDTDSVGKYFKYLYKLRGKEVGEGSDGEPLLDIGSLEFVKWIENPHSKSLNESVDGINFDRAMNGGYYGYKIMRVVDGNFVSGADGRIKLPAKSGVIHSMPGSGIYLTNRPDYVVDYYSYLDDESDDYDEGVIQYVFYLDDIVDGKSQLGDAEPEIGVSKAYVNGIIPIRDWNAGQRFR